MGCPNCGNTSKTSGCQGCQNCGSNECCGCTPTDSQIVCLANQIQANKKRGDQLMSYVECLNDTGEPFEPLCPLQECELPDCPNTGVLCDGGSPTGSLVGEPVGGEDCCQDEAGLNEFCQELAKKVRNNGKRLTRVERLSCETREKALKTILLDIDGNVRGGFTVSGKLVNFTAGSWEAATT